MKIAIGLIIGLVIGLAAVPSYEAVRGPDKLSTAEIEVALIKQLKGDRAITSARCKQRQYPTNEYDCFITPEGTNFGMTQAVVVHGKAVKTVGGPKL